MLIVLIFVPLLYFSKRTYRLISSLREESNLKKNILILSAENQVLKLRIDEYKKGIILETKARDDLGMIKKGEKVYLIKSRK